MSELPKTYEPQAIEEKWYAFWQEQGCFAADPHSAKPPYSIVIPPPNVTGMLTLGHVLNNTIQDILARRARMLGKEVLWLPGTDHAGIATQTVVERTLKKSGEIRHRDDLGREKFQEKVWQWKEKHGGIIIQQLKKLGASCDWSRERFTMDPAYSECVQRVFVDLYNKGLIYRGKRMVNWDPSALTALSDEEVIMKPQNGVLYQFKVEVSGAPGTFLSIATTRPETIPGDTAVAVNPKDQRYAHLIGKSVVRPLPPELPVAQRLIPIVGDEQVDFEFGTGVLKVTPAHDKADFEIGQRHKLAAPDVMNPNGTMNALAGKELAGKDRFEARVLAVERLRELGLLEKEEPYQNNVGFSERTDVPVEPRLSEQWFLKYPSVKEAKAAVADGAMKFFPERWDKVYDHWLGNIQDWCISRQLWWGHRVPVWYHKKNGDVFCENVPPADPENWTQDPDVLDTWFSSWLWPFATMGWPEKTETLAKFYPTTDLVTGPDIIFFWVARMIMAGFEYMGELPFRNVYFTGLIRDKQGRKMSKSLGNSPDPLDLIAQYGADALRFGIMRSAPLGQDILFDEKNVELGRNFCTKLWNAARFRQMHGGVTEGEINPVLLGSDDKWILLRLDAAIAAVTETLEGYQFSDAAQALYRFFWTEFCDWYLEASKAALFSGDEERKANTLAVLDFVIGHALRLFHPFLPFITEELWHGMGYREDLPDDQGGRTIMYAKWPARLGQDFEEYYGLEGAEQATLDKQAVVTAGRGLRRDSNIAANKKVRFILKHKGEVSTQDAEVLKLLLNAEALELNASYQPEKGTPTAITPLGDLSLPLTGLIDVAAEKGRLTKEIQKVEQELGKVATKLSNESFVGSAPPQVVEEHRQRQLEWQSKLAQLQRMLEAL
ncbi:MAG TPA: valine--tRNA ligase [Chthoniobacteraceae bacterium]|jgi:valyl-tRNA synthetase|nr:valine--tRNA ligase [Chthoniobacteraceae bacterium]